MEIIIGKTAGFCYGIKKAVEQTEKQLKNNGKLCCLGELTHNSQVLNKLKSEGLEILDNIELAKDKVIFRAHGIPKEIYEKSKTLDLEIYDFTCPNVLNIHDIANKYSNDNYYIFFIGEKNHPESIGTISFCGEYSNMIETEEDLHNALEEFNASKINKLLVIAQTTFSLEKFNTYVEKIKTSINKNVELLIKNTICNATRLRQEETASLSKTVECMIIIGGKNSSNTNKLYEIALENCNKAFFVETKNELDLELLKQFKKIGIMAGASTPQKDIDEIAETLKNL